MSYQRYSPEFKKSAVEKLLSRGTRPVSAILEELGVPSPTLYQWKLDFAKDGDMKKSSRPQDRSAEEKLKSLNEYMAAPAEQRGEILRKLGVHKEHVDAWQAQVLAALKHGALGKHLERSERAEDRRKIKDLEKAYSARTERWPRRQRFLFSKKKPT